MTPQNVAGIFSIRETISIWHLFSRLIAALTREHGGWEQAGVVLHIISIKTAIFSHFKLDQIR